MPYEDMEPSFPMALGTKRIGLGDREWSGEGLSVIATIGNPAVKNGSIILLGAADLNDARFGALDIATESWFSFAIFGRVARTRQLLDVGRWPNSQ